MDNVSLWGIKEIDNLLIQLPKKYSKTLINNTMADVGRKTVLKDMKRLAPVATEEWTRQKYESSKHKPGNLRKALGIIKSNRYLGVLVGIRSRNVFKRGGAVNDGWYAHMVEYGHWRTDAKKKKLYFVPPQPFLRPAFDMNKGIATKMISESFGKVADKFLKQAAKKINASR